MRCPTTAELRALTPMKYIPDLSSSYCTRVVDGDTIVVCVFEEASKRLYKFNVRVAGVDTPEMRGKSDEERTAARLAKRFVEERVLGQKVYLHDVSYDKYGRILARVFCGGVDLTRELLKHGMGVAYDGGRKKQFSAPSTSS